MTQPPFADWFDRDEVYRDVAPEWTLEEMLGQDGIFPFSQVAEKLDLNAHKFRKHLAKIGAAEALPRYGITKVGQYRVRMRVFRTKVQAVRKAFPHAEPQRVTLDPCVPTAHQDLPADLDREIFFQLRGNYRLNEIMAAGFLPYTQQDILFFLNKDGEPVPAEISGCWKTKKHYLVRMESFLVWVYSLYKGVDLATAKTAL